MDALIDLSWRMYPALFLMALGLLLALQGGLRFAAAFRSPFDGPSRLRVGLRGFRRGIIGLALAGLAAAWLWQVDWLAALSLVVVGEEVWESTLHIQAVGVSERYARRSSQVPMIARYRGRISANDAAPVARFGAALEIPAGRRRPPNRF